MAEKKPKMMEEDETMDETSSSSVLLPFKCFGTTDTQRTRGTPELLHPLMLPCIKSANQLACATKIPMRDTALTDLEKISVRDTALTDLEASLNKVAAYETSGCEALFFLLIQYILNQIVLVLEEVESETKFSKAKKNYGMTSILKNAFRISQDLNSSKILDLANVPFELCLKLVMAMINVIHKSNYMETPFIIWRTTILYEKRYPELFPDTFKCPSESGDLYSEHFIFSDLTSYKLKHATSSVKLLSILVHKPNSTISLNLKPKLATDRKGEGNLIGDMCVPGLTYCSVEVPTEVKKCKKRKFMSRNSYGSVVIRFKTKFFTQYEENLANYFQLGARKYTNELSQMLLIDQYKQDNWFVVCKSQKTIHKIPIIHDFKNFKWHLPDCKCAKNCCIHPEVLFSGNMELDFLEEEVQISFEKQHECRNNESKPQCDDCLISLKAATEFNYNKPVKVSVTKVFLDNTEETGRMDFSKYPTPNASTELPIFRFAISVPFEDRLKLINHQTKNSKKPLIKQEDFEEIKRIWDEEGQKFYCKDWKLEVL